MRTLSKGYLILMAWEIYLVYTAGYHFFGDREILFRRSADSPFRLPEWSPIGLVALVHMRTVKLRTLAISSR